MQAAHRFRCVWARQVEEAECRGAWHTSISERRNLVMARSQSSSKLLKPPQHAVIRTYAMAGGQGWQPILVSLLRAAIVHGVSSADVQNECCWPSRLSAVCLIATRDVQVSSSSLSGPSSGTASMVVRLLLMHAFTTPV